MFSSYRNFEITVLFACWLARKEHEIFQNSLKIKHFKLVSLKSTIIYYLVANVILLKRGICKIQYIKWDWGQTPDYHNGVTEPFGQYYQLQAQIDWIHLAQFLWLSIKKGIKKAKCMHYKQTQQYLSQASRLATVKL